MREIDPLHGPRTGLGVEHKGGAVPELHVGFGEFADTQLGSLQISQNPDRAVALALNFADRGHKRPHAILRRVAHIDAEHVGAGFKQPLDHDRLR